MNRHRKDQQKFELQSTSQPLEQVAGDHLVGMRASTGGVTQSSSMGKIEVSHRTVSHIASQAAQQCYGVVGLAPIHSRPGLVELLRGDEEHKGVEVNFSEGKVIVDLHVVIEYGTRISEVARNIMSSVKFALESALGVPVVQVNVNVQDIRVESER